MKPATFIFIVFVVSVMADITLNDLSRKPLSKHITSPIILALRPYFKEKSILVAGVYALSHSCFSSFCKYVCIKIFTKNINT